MNRSFAPKRWCSQIEVALPFELPKSQKVLTGRPGRIPTSPMRPCSRSQDISSA